MFTNLPKDYRDPVLIPATQVEADAIHGDVLMEFMNICKDRQKQNQSEKPATVDLWAIIR